MGLLPLLTEKERKRLTAILGLLGSEHEGERASAFLHAEAFRKKHGLTWDELVRPPESPKPYQEIPQCQERLRPQYRPEPSAPKAQPVKKRLLARYTSTPYFWAFVVFGLFAYWAISDGIRTRNIMSDLWMLLVVIVAWGLHRVARLIASVGVARAAIIVIVIGVFVPAMQINFLPSLEPVQNSLLNIVRKTCHDLNEYIIRFRIAVDRNRPW